MFFIKINILRKVLRQAIISISAISLALVGCQPGSINTGAPTVQDNTIDVWWSEGYYPEETQAIRQSVQAWQEKTGSDVNLTFFSEKDLVQQVENAVQSGELPDVIYGYSIDLLILPQLAWQGKLADTSSILEPLKDNYDPEALNSVNYFNNSLGKRSYYAVPISQQAIHIHYWQDLLEESGSDGNQIPNQWSDFWSFWQVAQQNLNKKGISNIHCIGLPMSMAATDTYTIFEQFLEAYNVNLIDANGNLRFSDPQVRQGIIQALTAYTEPYLSGSVPPSATEWADPDNNINFLSNLTLMTANGTLSIPGSQRGDDVNYFQRMRTILWPNKPDGAPMRYVTLVKQVAIFQEASQREEAKELVAFLAEPKNLETYLKGSQGRFFPVMPAIADSPFWTNKEDPHISVALKQFENTRSSYVVLNPAYSEVLSENVWAEAIYNIATKKLTVEKAADQAIKKIETIFSEWK